MTESVSAQRTAQPVADALEVQAIAGRAAWDEAEQRFSTMAPSRVH